MSQLLAMVNGCVKMAIYLPGELLPAFTSRHPRTSLMLCHTPMYLEQGNQTHTNAHYRGHGYRRGCARMHRVCPPTSLAQVFITENGDVGLGVAKPEERLSTSALLTARSSCSSLTYAFKSMPPRICTSFVFARRHRLIWLLSVCSFLSFLPPTFSSLCGSYPQ